MRKLARRIAYADAYEEAMRKIAAGDFADPEKIGPKVGAGQDQLVAKVNAVPANVPANVPSVPDPYTVDVGGKKLTIPESLRHGGVGDTAANAANVANAAEGAAEGVSKKPGLFRRALGSKAGKVGLGLAAAGALAYGASKLFGGGEQEEPEEQGQMEPAQPDEYMDRMHEQQMQGRQVMRQRSVPPHMHQQMEEMQDQLAPQYMEG